MKPSPVLAFIVRIPAWVPLGLVLGGMVWLLLGIGGPLDLGRTIIGPTGLLLLGFLGSSIRWLFHDQARLHPAWWWPLPFLFWLGVSHLWLTPTPWDSLGELAVACQAYLLYWMGLHHFSQPKQRYGLLLGLGGLVVVALGGAFIQTVVSADWHPLGAWARPENYQSRIAGFFIGPNSLAGFLLLLLPLSLAGAILPRWPGPARILAGALGLFMLVLLVLTVSRAGWIAFGVQAVLLPFFLRPRLKGKVHLLCVFLLSLAGFLLLLFFSSALVRDRIQTAVDVGGEVKRPVMWAAAWDMWQDTPITGQGLGSYASLVETFREPMVDFGVIAAHNDYLEMLAELGLVGTVAALGFLGALFWVGWHRWHQLPWERQTADEHYRERNLPREVRRRLRRKRERGHLTKVPQDKVLLTGLWVGLFGFCFHLIFEFHHQLALLMWMAALLSGLLIGTARKQKSREAPRPRWQLGTLVGIALWTVPVMSQALPYWSARGWWYEERERLEDLLRTNPERVFDEPALLTRPKLAGEAILRQQPDFLPAARLQAMATIHEVRVERRAPTEIGREARTILGPLMTEDTVSWETPWLLAQAMLLTPTPEGEIEETLAEARRRGPHRAEIWTTQAQFHLHRQGDREAARAAVAQAIALDPSYEPARLLSLRLRR